MPKTPAVAVNLSAPKLLDQYSLRVGDLSVPFYELKFTGTEVVSFLQNQSTFNIEAISAGSFQLVSLLDPQGRVECYGWLLNRQGEFSYLVPTELLEQSILRLNKFLI